MSALSELKWHLRRRYEKKYDAEYELFTRTIASNLCLKDPFFRWDLVSAVVNSFTGMGACGPVMRLWNTRRVSGMGPFVRTAFWKSIPKYPVRFGSHQSPNSVVERWSFRKFNNSRLLNLLPHRTQEINSTGSCSESQVRVVCVCVCVSVCLSAGGKCWNIYIYKTLRQKRFPSLASWALLDSTFKFRTKIQASTATQRTHFTVLSW